MPHHITALSPCQKTYCVNVGEGAKVERLWEFIPWKNSDMIPSALRSRLESSSFDFSFIQPSIPGVPGSPIPSACEAAALINYAVTGMNESRRTSSRGLG